MRQVALVEHAHATGSPVVEHAHATGSPVVEHAHATGSSGRACSCDR